MSLAALGSLFTRHGYWIVIPLSMIEGPTVAVVTGAFSARGYFNPYVVCTLFVAKDIIVDGSYYYLGRLARMHSSGARVMTKLHVTPSEVERARRLWTANSWRTMFVAKLAWGLSPLLLAVAGLIDVSPATFLLRAVGVAILQYAVLVLLGYYFGSALGGVSTALRVTQFGVAIAALTLILYLRYRLRAETREARA